ncbi:uncharacterized protein [Antedon mediterranea]|uniref:uncharacterized protein n=1 Tax=Antedon mediterranea TaxID=105859 RepID=UPI003AF47AA7
MSSSSDGTAEDRRKDQSPNETSTQNGNILTDCWPDLENMSSSSNGTATPNGNILTDLERNYEVTTITSDISFVEDGQVSSLIVFFCIISFYIAFLFALYSNGQYAVHRHILDWISITNYSISMTMMIYILRKKVEIIRNPEGHVFCNDERRPLLLSGQHPAQDISRETSSEPIAGVYLFGICNIFQSLIYITLIGMCDIDKYQEIIYIIYNCFQVFFTCIQIAFFRCFKSASFRNSSLFQYAFTLTMSANILCLMSSTAEEIKDEYHEMTWPLINVQPANTTDSKDIVAWCYSQLMVDSSPMQTLLRICQSFSKEYNILAVSILLHYWTNLHSNDRSGNILDGRPINENVRDIVEVQSYRVSWSQLRNRTQYITASNTEYIDHGQSTELTTRGKIKCIHCVVIIGIILLCVATIGMSELFNLIPHSHSVSTIEIFGLLIYKFTMLIATEVGKKHSNKTPIKLCKSLSRSERLLLFCLVGIFVISCCDGIAATSNVIIDVQNLTEKFEMDTSEVDYNLTRGIGLFVMAVVNIVQLSRQTMLILKSRRARSMDDHSKVIIRRCLIYLMIANAAHWLGNAYFSPGSEIYSSDQNDVVFGKSIFVINIFVYPLAAYIRFISVSLLYQIYKLLK